jgi:hypothetical protein
MHKVFRGLVNIKYWIIFKGIFEVQKSTRNGVLNAKIRAFATCRFRINHVCVKHDWELRDLYGSLRRIPVPHVEFRFSPNPELAARCRSPVARSAIKESIPQ